MVLFFSARTPFLQRLSPLLFELKSSPPPIFFSPFFYTSLGPSPPRKLPFPSTLKPPPPLSDSFCVGPHLHHWFPLHCPPLFPFFSMFLVLAWQPLLLLLLGDFFSAYQRRSENWTDHLRLLKNAPNGSPVDLPLGTSFAFLPVDALFSQAAPHSLQIFFCKLSPFSEHACARSVFH